MKHINYPKNRKSPKPFTEEHLRKISEANKLSGKKKWEDPEYRERMLVAGGVFRKGYTPWHKGKKAPQLSLNRKGKTFTEESKIKISTTLRNKYKNGEINVWCKGKENPHFAGDKNPKWKGGITPLNEKIRKSREYALWRTAVFMRDDYTCQECKARGVKLEADHIKPFSLYPELRFAIDNGRTLCKPCHRQTDTYAGKIYSYKERMVN